MRKYGDTTVRADFLTSGFSACSAPLNLGLRRKRPCPALILLEYMSERTVWSLIRAVCFLWIIGGFVYLLAIGRGGLLAFLLALPAVILARIAWQTALLRLTKACRGRRAVHDLASSGTGACSAPLNLGR